MSSNEIENNIDTKLRAGSRYFLNSNIVPSKAIEISYSNPNLIIRSGLAESILNNVEKIDAGYRFGRIDGSPNLDADYLRASSIYKEKIEEAISNGYVEVEESEIYLQTTQIVQNKLIEQHLLRPFWLPEVSTELTNDWLQSSHYGGASYLKNKNYPSCKNCKHPLTHLLQLNLSELPENFDFTIREGALKIYYCVDQSGDCELFDPKQNANSPNYFCTYVPVEELENIVEYPEYGENSDYVIFSPVQIKSWNYGGEELPDEEYLTNFMPQISSLFTKVEKHAHTFFEIPYESDKLGGWPLSAGFDEIAKCKECSQPMTNIYHLDPYAYVEFSPASVIGRVFICPNHKEEIFFTYNYF
ncbi:hypothetical protein COW36_20005 [bacterium (Candidatus Blackallbacteria) CG17_big_fil_post_rev_8_21_14_2_50_48_46]|uniref:DUF1963 domain-containing protein n=1 Tax=bacterium (Candidatus Blackallbacteria) CG17_big_fil_post_rev_8_21_14_2_50_48_46 TaxID=2014261 RepID=A0A2M7G046_9BACT|nr:MAG: hypothetical protein COW64_15290 [bacterium (Candidatus Blackallbacteria) CG18_big_fil_WC_8_21_14_2_50_49_26]PIW14933.1 MAG: hypothetical protein COW36_20005 [bacterium (Candidatus Blackallbacteria) CG17_big_fil_post_rev_8_21_14_2_50_48_46]PIW44279.1 MAG: hypothetical protein COW20_24355 [bacterium (Candidatus Blackallbacteria) CG13_big_fil_rev_8_21_14_2_50_49_14]